MPAEQPLGTDIPTTPEGEDLYNRAINLMYDENFDKLTKMFEGIQPQQIPNLLSEATNTVLMKMEQDNPGLTLDVIAEVGFRLLEALVADLTELGLLEGMTREHYIGAIADIINDYALQHKETISPQQLQEFLQKLSGGQVEVPEIQEPAQTGEPAPLLQQQPNPQGMM